MTPSSAPDLIETPRLELRRPRARDADAIFSRYSSDPDVTRLVGWPMHRSVDEARGFIAYSDGRVGTVARRSVSDRLSRRWHAPRQHRPRLRDAVSRPDRIRAREGRLGIGVCDRSAGGDGRRRPWRRRAPPLCALSPRAIAPRRTCSKSAILRGKVCCAAMRSFRICAGRAAGCALLRDSPLRKAPNGLADAILPLRKMEKC